MIMQHYISIFAYLIVFPMVGVVDQVQGSIVQAEVTGNTFGPQTVDLPLWVFPCEVEEGDMFYFTKTNGVFELRCGEPPE